MLLLEDLELNKIVRIWIDDYTISLESSNLKQIKIKASVYDIQRKRIVVEVKLPRNSSYYVMLGCSFEPNEKGYLTVKVSYKKDANEVFLNSLLNNKNDIALLGINEEYADSILGYHYIIFLKLQAYLESDVFLIYRHTNVLK